VSAVFDFEILLIYGNQAVLNDSSTKLIDRSDEIQYQDTESRLSLKKCWLVIKPIGMPETIRAGVNEIVSIPMADLGHRAKWESDRSAVKFDTKELQFPLKTLMAAIKKHFWMLAVSDWDDICLAWKNPITLLGAQNIYLRIRHAEEFGFVLKGLRTQIIHSENTSRIWLYLVPESAVVPDDEHTPFNKELSMLYSKDINAKTVKDKVTAHVPSGTPGRKATV
jgi:hypothetical protein